MALNTFAIAFGWIGLAGTWSLGADSLGFTPVIGDIMWGAAGLILAVLLIAHTAVGHRSDQRMSDQLRHPVQGPVGALFPVVTMLLGARVYLDVPAVGSAMVIGSAVLSALLAGWMLAQWTNGSVVVDSVHGGYLLPTVAGGFTAAKTLADVGHPNAATAAFAVGTVGWLLIFPVVLARVALRPSLPDILIPTQAIFVAPPAVAGIAYFALNGHRIDDVALGLAGLTVVLVIMQLALVPRYRRIDFTIGFWSFAFPLAAVAEFGLQWMKADQPAWWREISWGMVGIVSVVIGAIAIGTGVLWWRRYMVFQSRSRGFAACALAPPSEPQIAPDREPTRWYPNPG